MRIINEATGDWVYCLRIRGTSFRPKVFELGSYRIEVGEGKERRIVEGVQAKSLTETGVLEVEF